MAHRMTFGNQKKNQGMREFSNDRNSFIFSVFGCNSHPDHERTSKGPMEDQGKHLKGLIEPHWTLEGGPCDDYEAIKFNAQQKTMHFSRLTVQTRIFWPCIFLLLIIDFNISTNYFIDVPYVPHVDSQVLHGCMTWLCSYILSFFHHLLIYPNGFLYLILNKRRKKDLLVFICRSQLLHHQGVVDLQASH